MTLDIPLAWLQLTYQKNRFLVSILGVAFAIFLMFVQIGIQNALYESSVRLHRSLRADLVLLSSKYTYLNNYKPTYSKRILYKSLSLNSIDTVSYLYVSGVSWKTTQTGSYNTIYLLGFNPDVPAFMLPEINQNLSKLKLKNTVFFDRLSRPEFGSIVTDFQKQGAVKAEILTLGLSTRKITVAGLFTLGNSFSIDGFIITGASNFVELTNFDPDKILMGLINLKPGINPEDVKQELSAILPDDTKIFTKEEFINNERSYWAKHSPIGFIFNLGVLVGFFIGIVIVYQIIYNNIYDNLTEYAVLKTMAYPIVYFINVVFQSALIMAFMSYVPGLIFSYLIYIFINKSTGLPMFMNYKQAFVVLFLTIFMCLLAGISAAYKLQDADPIELFS